MSELKPCPFCGGKAMVWVGDVSGLYRVGCMDEQCFGYVMAHHKTLKDVAITTWNRRATDGDEC
ncbi:MAG: Lar family restriction alleviation protein [Clostridia bacterium]|nr:Lar family restriction alleviation protein [Clostridia bacterium]